MIPFGGLTYLPSILRLYFQGWGWILRNSQKRRFFPSLLQLRHIKCIVSSTCTPSRHLLATRKAGVNGTGSKETSGQRRSLTEKTVSGLIASSHKLLSPFSMGEKTKFKRHAEERMDKICVCGGEGFAMATCVDDSTVNWDIMRTTYPNVSISN